MVDVCDRNARLDAYGLGPGVYPKAEAPKAPFHPHRYCLTAPKLTLDLALKPRFNPLAGAVLVGLPPEQAARVGGSRDRLHRALNGETLEDLYNADGSASDVDI